MLALGEGPVTRPDPVGRVPLLDVRELVVERGHAAGWLGSTGNLVRAVDGVSFSVGGGESFAIVGESGCGKTSLALALLRLIPAHAGSVVFDGIDILGLDEKSLRAFRRDVQVVFQDPFSSLHPHKRIEKILSEPYEIHTDLRGAVRRREIVQLLEHVGLSERFLQRTAKECSGGQRQRVAVARALALRPRLIVLDEPVSALDVSVRAQIMDLLARLQHEFGLTYIFISHDLALVRSFCHSTAVMYLGRIVEDGPSAHVLGVPAHPYTRTLLEAVPIPDPEIERQRTRSEIRGEVASAANPPAGCRFHPRCSLAEGICAEIEPPLHRTGRGRSRCHFWQRVMELPPAVLSTAAPDTAHPTEVAR
jgi:oligopeptide/dipeptide ABC transporter ATP-binding protein